MNVNVRPMKLRCVVFLLFHFYTLSSTIIHSTFGHLRNGWGIRPANHYYQCDGLKTSGSMISLGVESVVSFVKYFIFKKYVLKTLNLHRPSEYFLYCRALSC